MTYFPHQHEKHKRRIGDITRQLDYIYEDMIPPLMRDLQLIASDAHAALIDARKDLAQAMSAMERAKKHLPEPHPGPTLYPTAAEVMEREG